MKGCFRNEYNCAC